MQKDLQELMKFTFPTYKDAALNIPVRKEDFSTHSQEVKRAVTEQGETLHMKRHNYATYAL